MLNLVAPDNALTTQVTVGVAISSSRTDDLDMILQAPDGRAITLASDVGGTSPAPA